MNYVLQMIILYLFIILDAALNTNDDYDIDNDNNIIKVYTTEDIKTEMGLEREDLVALAYFLGLILDYSLPYLKIQR